MFSTKYEPARPLFAGWRTWQEWKSRFFGYHRDVPPEAAAQILGGRLVYSQRRQGQWVGVIAMEQVTMPAYAMRWQEWVLITSQTALPGCN